MNKETDVLQNLLKNLALNQKIAIGLFLVISITLIIILFSLVSDDSEIGENMTDRTEEVQPYVDEQGYTITPVPYTNNQGEEINLGTREDPYGNVTTLDPDSITTYFPYQVMREHNNTEPTLRYFLTINQDEQIIYADIEDCDIENDKILVEDYLKSIPIDISNYTVNYSFHSTNADCGQ